MSKGRRKISIAAWSVMVFISRILYLVLGWNTVTDDYGFYQHAMIRAEESEPLLSSGLSFAYSNFLSILLRFTGNRICVVFVVQMIMQVMALLLFFISCYLLWGMLAAFVAGTILAAIPAVLISSASVEPFTYFLFLFSVLFFLYTCLYFFQKKDGWHRSSLCELYLMILGFGTGVLVVWNYIGWMLLLLIGVIIAKTYTSTKKMIQQQKALNEKLMEKEQVMSSGSQVMILLFGMLLGMFATLMKYTGFSGKYLQEQIQWWLVQYRQLPVKCQEIGWEKAVLLLLVFLIAAGCGRLQKIYIQRKEDREFMMEKPQMAEKKEDTKEPETFVTEDGRTIEYLKNPLPVPKKHVAKELNFDFDFDSDSNQMDEFDIVEFDEKLDWDDSEK